MSHSEPAWRPQPQPRHTGQFAPSAPPPGWYPDGQGQLRWFNGLVWTNATAKPHHAGPDANTRAIAGVLVAILGILGVVLNMQSVSLLTGSDKVWIGAGMVVAAAVVCLVVRALPSWVTIVLIVVAALTVANGVYVEVQLDKKRDELRHMLGSSMVLHVPANRA